MSSTITLFETKFIKISEDKIYVFNIYKFSLLVIDGKAPISMSKELFYIHQSALMDDHVYFC